MRKLGLVFVLWFFAVYLILGAAFMLLPPENTGLIYALSQNGLRILPIALCLAMLFSLSYSCRKALKPLPSSLLLCAMGLAFSLASALGFDALGEMAPFQARSEGLLAESPPGLIIREGSMDTVLLTDAEGLRIVSLPERELLVEDPAQMHLPELPSGGGAPFFSAETAATFDLNADLNLAAKKVGTLLDSSDNFLLSLLNLALFLAALCFLLVSCRFVFRLAVWPFANLILGGLLFRLFLAFLSYINSDDMQFFLNYFFHGLLPLPLLSPLLLVFLGLLACMLGFVTATAQKESKHEH
jgi:hypothetical protein